MNGMDNERYSGPMSGPAPENSSFAAVGMHQVGSPFPADADQGACGLDIAPWRNGTDEAWQRLEETGEGGQLWFQGSFGTAGEAADQAQLKSGFGKEAQNGGHRVFLSSANNQAGDDMQNTHGCRPAGQPEALLELENPAGPGFDAFLDLAVFGSLSIGFGEE